MTARWSLRELMANETDGGRALLAGEVLRGTGRLHGPRDGRCEVCGRSAERFTLYDWIRWYCEPCVLAEMQEH